MLRNVILGWILLLPSSLWAQSLIVGIPSADLAPKGEWEITHESQIKLGPSKESWNSFNILCYGLGNGMELTATANQLSSTGFDDFALGLGLKKVITFREKGEWKATVGTNLLGGTDRMNLGLWSYAHLSTRLKPYRTRLTAGFNYGTEHAFGFRDQRMTDYSTRTPVREFGLILGIEQPINKHFSLVADWISGQHALSAFIPALQYDHGHQVFIVGYKIPNGGSDQALILECMIGL